MKQHRAWALLEIKGVDAEQRVITGIATSASTDRTGDIVEPAGAEYRLPIPLLWQHDSRQPIGEVFAAKKTAAGIEIKARIAKTDTPGQLKDRLDMAWESIKIGLVKGLSIGFKSLEESYDKATGGMRFLKWLWLELSAVTIPANGDASITGIKALDVGLPASGNESEVVDPPIRPASRAPLRVTRSTGRQMKKSLADQIKDWEATRAAKAARVTELASKGAESGEMPDDAEAEEQDNLVAEIERIDAQLVRLNKALKIEATAPLVEVKGATPQQALETRQVPRITVTRELPKGILFARYAMCMGAARGFPGEAMRLAQEHYKDDPGVAAMIEISQKTAVAGASTTGSHNIDDMVPYNVMNDFIEYLRPGSIVGKFGGPNPGGGGSYPALNRVGFNERVSGMSTGFTSAWVGEGLPTLPSAAVTFNTTLLFHKLGTMSILTKEAIRFSNPAAEARVRDDLARSINAKMDLDFVDPAKAAVAASSPASITDSIAANTPSGTAATNVRKDIATLLALFAANNLDPADLVIIMSASMAAQISMMTNTLGNDDFPLLSMKGGTLRGIPVIVSEHLTAVGSPSTQTIIMVKAGDIYLADDGAVTVEASDQASVEMADVSSQSGITGTGASLVSLWQNGLVGLKATREVTWKRRRTTAVQYLSPCAYVAA